MSSNQKKSLFAQLKQFVIGNPKDVHDKSLFHRLSLIPFLAWVGLGADGLSSSSYGPEETFKALGTHTYLSIPLALLVALTVIIVSSAYSRIIEAFPHGGGGYLVASKLLGRKMGVLSGSALLIDYVLTITVSVSAAGDAIFSFLPPESLSYKLLFEGLILILLTIINLRGVRESVLVLAPIFIIFLLTHAFAIFWGVFGNLEHVTLTLQKVHLGFQGGFSQVGPLALIMLMIHAYSLGGGTYTGIEAVSNGLPIMREPRVTTAKRTMLYMASSLAITAAGLLFCYLLWSIVPETGKTMNALLFEKMMAGSALGQIFVIVALFSEGMLLVVAAQAGFIDGPRVLANMANDSWMPKSLGSLSDRLTTANGIFLMGVLAFAALMYTRGEVSHLVVMYSINVFLTFTLSIFGMLKATLQNKVKSSRRASDIFVFSLGTLLCFMILVITVHEKFEQGGWITLLLTSMVVVICFYIRKHYLAVAKKVLKINPKSTAELLQNSQPRTAAILVANYGGLGIHTFNTILETFPQVFNHFVFISIGVVDSGKFKGENSVEELKKNTEVSLKKYRQLAESMKCPASIRMALGTDLTETGYRLCEKVAQEFPHVTFFAGKVIFEDEKWFHRILHNETALVLQRKLQLDGHTMVILPAKV